MCVFGGCESKGMTDDSNKWLRHAATDVNAKNHHKKEHPFWWLSQADIDRPEPKPLTRWQRFCDWWRNK